MSTLLSVRNTGTAFPLIEVESHLRDQLNAVVKQQASVRGQVLSSDPTALETEIFDIDSLAVVEILCVLDEILPFFVDESIVRAGGYSSIHYAILDLIPKVETRWRKYAERAA